MSLPEAVDETHKDRCTSPPPGRRKIGGDKVIVEKQNVTPNGFWKRHLDKIGVGGSLFIYVSFNQMIAGLGIAGLVIASLLNVFLRLRQLKNQPK